MPALPGLTGLSIEFNPISKEINKELIDISNIIDISNREKRNKTFKYIIKILKKGKN